MKSLKFVVIFILLIFLTPALWAQYQLSNTVLSNGISVSTNDTYQLQATLGQPLIGETGNSEYSWQLGIWYTIDVFTGIDDYFELLPKQFQLFQNYPNPFNPLTTIKYAVPKRTMVTIDLYNLLGQKVSTLVKGNKAPGNYKVKLQAVHLASGLYFYCMYAKDFHAVKRLIILK